MIPLLIPRSQRQNLLLQQALHHLIQHFQIREIDDSPTNPGDLVFPSLGIACILVPQRGSMDDLVIRAGKILERRRCLILASQDDVWDVQLRYLFQQYFDGRMALEYDFPWGSVLGVNDSGELVDVILAFIRGLTSGSEHRTQQ